MARIPPPPPTIWHIVRTLSIVAICTAVIIAAGVYK